MDENNSERKKHRSSNVLPSPPVLVLVLLEFVTLKQISAPYYDWQLYWGMKMSMPPSVPSLSSQGGSLGGNKVVRRPDIEFIAAGLDADSISNVQVYFISDNLPLYTVCLEDVYVVY